MGHDISRWRLHRRMFQQSFRQTSIPSRHAAILRSAHNMLFSFLREPTSYSNHLHKSVTSFQTDVRVALKLISVSFTSSFILSIVYAHEPKEGDDHIVHIMNKYVDLAVAALGPGATMVMETFPFRKYATIMRNGLYLIFI